VAVGARGPPEDSIPVRGFDGDLFGWRARSESRGLAGGRSAHLGRMDYFREARDLNRLRALF
jgi:hypothetical protein